MPLALRFFFHLAFRFLIIMAVLLLALIFFIARPFNLESSEKINTPQPDISKLRQHVSALTEDFTPRDWKHPENLTRSAEYIREHFLQATTMVSFQSYEVQGNDYHNVIAKFGSGSSPQIVVGAHYDAFEELPGADDNASGVAGLLELARLLSIDPVSVPLTLVAYTLEESPFFGTKKMGSAVHAEWLRAQRVPLKLMISLETIGYFSEARGSQSYPNSLLSLIYPSSGNFIAIVDRVNFKATTIDIKRAFAASTDLAVESINAPPGIKGIDYSDHKSYWDAGYDAVMITDTAFFRNHNYHTERDTADSLDYQKMGKVVQGVYAYLKGQ